MAKIHVQLEHPHIGRACFGCKTSLLRSGRACFGCKTSLLHIGTTCFGCKTEKNLSVCFLMSFVLIYLSVQDATNGKC
jgi:predicted amidophosphoribosyltransferase